MGKTLTIGMATYDDYDGVYFTIQALRLYHPICQTNDVEFIVVDNNPHGKHANPTKKLMKDIGGVYIPYDKKKSSFVKYEIPKHASGKYTIQMDSHVLLFPESIDYFLKYFHENKNCKDLVQGPMFSQKLNVYNTHWNPVFRGHMYGIWANNHEAYKKGEPFEIPMLGMGLFGYETKNFPKISDKFNGFGAEEGVIHDYFKIQNKGKIICIPQFKWVHRFDRPEGVKFPLKLEDRIYNYFLGYLDIYKDLNHPIIKEVYKYFKDKIPPKRIDFLLEKAKNEL